MSIIQKVEDIIFKKLEEILRKIINNPTNWQRITAYILIILLGLVFLSYHFRQPLLNCYKKIFPSQFPEEVSGILVLHFEGDSPDNALQRDLISTFNDELSKQELEKRIVVWESSETVTEAKGLTKAHQNARKIGKKHRACLVIWGNRIEGNKIHQRLTIVNDKLRTFVGGERMFVAQTIKELRLPSELIDKPIQLTNFIVGFSLFEQKDYSLALNYFKRAIEYSAEDSTDQNDISFYTGTSHLFLAQGNKEMGWHLLQAISYYEKAAKFYVKKDSLIRYASALNNIGIAYAQLPSDKENNLKKAISVLDSALHIFREDNFQMEKFEVKNNLAAAFAEFYTEDPLREPNEALDLYQAVLRFDIKNESPLLWAVINNNLGSIYYNLSTQKNGNNLKKAIKSYDAALKIFDENEFSLNWAIIQSNLGKVYTKLPENICHDHLDRAIKAYESALRVLDKKKYPIYYVTLQNRLSEVKSIFTTVSQAWIKQFSSNHFNHDEPIDIAVDSKGNVYITGNSPLYGADYLTIKYDPSGTQKWVARYDGECSGDDFVADLYVDKNGNVYVTGRSNGPEPNNEFEYDFATVKYDSNGHEQWISRYNTCLCSESEAETALTVDGDGNVYVTGTSGVVLPYLKLDNNIGKVLSSVNITTVKYDRNGIQQWVQTRGGNYFGAYCEFPKIVLDNSGFIYITGTIPSSSSNENIAIIKYSSEGSEQWLRYYDGGNCNDNSTDIAVDKEGNIIVAGTSKSPIIIKYDGKGKVLWKELVNYGINLTALAIDSLNNIYVVCQDDTTYFTIKYNRNGQRRWISKYQHHDVSYKENKSDIVTDIACNVYLTACYESSYNHLDYFVIKYDSTGSEQWISKYNGLGRMQGSAITVDYSGNVFVTNGINEGKNSGCDFITKKYDSSGLEQWRKKYIGIGSSSDKSISLIVNDNCNIYVAGESKTTGPNYLLIKYDSDGNQEWIARYEKNSRFYNHRPAGFAIDTLENVYITGTGWRYYHKWTEEGYVTAKYNREGLKQWDAIFQHGDAIANAITTDDLGNVYITGAVSSDYGLNYGTIKYDSSGILQWDVYYDAYSYYSNRSIDKATSIAADGDGDVYVTGWCDNGRYCATIKYDSRGIEQWVGYDYFYSKSKPSSLLIDDYRNVYVTGNTRTYFDEIFYFISKYNCDGTKHWSVEYPTGDSVKTNPSIAIDNYGNIYMTGAVNSSSNNLDYLTLKYSSSGKENWVALYNGPGDSTDIGTAVSVDCEGNVYVTGSSWSGSSFDYATIKYDMNGNQQTAYIYNSEENADDQAIDIGLDPMGNIYITGTSKGDSWSRCTTIKYNRMAESIKK